MIFSKNRFPPRIKSGAGFFGIMRLRQPRQSRKVEGIGEIYVALQHMSLHIGVRSIKPVGCIRRRDCAVRKMGFPMLNGKTAIVTGSISETGFNGRRTAQ
jgi:hypothetical protein